MIEFKCTKCGFQREVSDKYAGKSVRCPECKTPNRVSQSAPKSEVVPSETYKFNCPHCDQKIRLKKEYAGRRLKCTKCAKIIQAPEITDGMPELKLADDPTSVLRVGQDQPLGADAGDMNSAMDELMQLEANSPAVNIPKPASVEQAPPEPKGRGSQSRSGQSRKMPMIIGVVVVAIIGVIGLAMFAGSGDDGGSKSKTSVDTGMLKEFAKSYIYMLGDSDVDGAWNMLAAETRNNTTKEQLKTVADMIVSEEITSAACYMTHLESSDQQELYYLVYAVAYQEGGRDVAMVLEGIGDEPRVADIGIIESYGPNKASLGLRSHNELSSVVIDAKVGIVTAIVKKFGVPLMGILFVVWLFSIVVMYMVYDKADEPGWAIFVPIYNNWTYARVADQPGWVGLATVFSGGVPVAGPFITLGIWLYLTFNIGKNFDRSIGFCIGLCVLPFIFFPILAFTE